MGSIEGTVTDQAGDPIEAATVTAESGSVRYITETDEQGIYKIDNLDAGDYTVRVEKVGFDPEQKTVTVESSLTTRADFTLSPAMRKVIGETDDPWGFGMLARTTATTGNNYALKAVNKAETYDSYTSPPRAIRAEANTTAIEGVLPDEPDRVDPEAGVIGKETSTTGSADGITGVTRSVDAASAGVVGEASASTGEPLGVFGYCRSPDGTAVYASNFRSSNQSGTGYAVFSKGRLGVEADPAFDGDFSRHAATIENTSEDPNGDILGLRTQVTDPGTNMNYISFTDPNGQVGQIQGDGSGGVEFVGSLADFAEYFPKRDHDAAFEAGEVVGLHAGEVVPAEEATDALLVVSTAPLVTGNQPVDGDDNDDYVKLSLVGQVPVQVADSVTHGDVLVASHDHPGKVVAREAADGEGDRPMVGLAMADADAEAGEVLALVGGPTPTAATDRPLTTAAQADLATKDDRIDQLESETERIAELEADRDDLKADMDELKTDRNELKVENERLRARLARIEDQLGLDPVPDATPADD